MLKKFESFLKTLKLDFRLYKHKSVELDLKGKLNPNNLLEHCFLETQGWLGFNEFYREYVSILQNELNYYYKSKHTDIGSDEFLRGLEARLYRTQFSILTEYQAYYLCSEIFGESNVIRSKELDNKGVDFRIIYNDEYFNIHSFVDTKRAWEKRNYKSRFKKANKVEGIHINLPYDKSCKNFTSKKLPNGFAVYTTEYINYLKQQIDCGIIKKDKYNRSYSPKVSNCPNFKI